MPYTRRSFVAGSASLLTAALLAGCDDTPETVDPPQSDVSATPTPGGQDTPAQAPLQPINVDPWLDPLPVKSLNRSGWAWVDQSDVVCLMGRFWVMAVKTDQTDLFNAELTLLGINPAQPDDIVVGPSAPTSIHRFAPRLLQVAGSDTSLVMFGARADGHGAWFVQSDVVGGGTGIAPGEMADVLDGTITPVFTGGDVYIPDKGFFHDGAWHSTTDIRPTPANGNKRGIYGKTDGGGYTVLRMNDTELFKAHPGSIASRVTFLEGALFSVYSVTSRNGKKLQSAKHLFYNAAGELKAEIPATVIRKEQDYLLRSEDGRWIITNRVLLDLKTNTMVEVPWGTLGVVGDTVFGATDEGRGFRQPIDAGPKVAEPSKAEYHARAVTGGFAAVTLGRAGYDYEKTQGELYICRLAE